MNSLISLLFTLAAITAFAKGKIPEEESQLKFGLQAYNQKNYTNAIIFTEPLINELKLSKQKNIMLAHEIIAMSYCETNQDALGEKHLKAIFDFDQSFVSSLPSSPPCKKWFTSGPKSSALSFTEKSSLWWTLAPLGILQFKKNQSAKAWTFLLTQSLGLSLGVTSYMLFKSSQNKDGTVPNGSHAETYRWLNWIGFGSAGLAYGLNTIDSYRSLP